MRVGEEVVNSAPPKLVFIASKIFNPNHKNDCNVFDFLVIGIVHSCNIISKIENDSTQLKLIISLWFFNKHKSRFNLKSLKTNFVHLVFTSLSPDRRKPN